MSKDTHYCLTIPIGLRALNHNNELYSLPVKGRIAQILSKEFEKNLSNPQRRCQVCGSIPFDIEFTDGITSYFFTCWKIMRDGKTIIETDFKKLERFCQQEKKE